MFNRLLGSVTATVVLLLATASGNAQAADDYAMDKMHSCVTFKISHLGLAWIHGRFNDFSGTFTIDSADPAKCSFALEIKATSVDTTNSQRDEHLRSPDFFNVKQFPALSFKSTSVKAIKDGYEVTGNLTMHGVTKPVTLNLVGGRKVEFPPKTQRTGFSTEVTLKRSVFEVGSPTFAEALGDEVHISVSFEGTKK